MGKCTESPRLEEILGKVKPIVRFADQFYRLRSPKESREYKGWKLTTHVWVSISGSQSEAFYGHRGHTGQARFRL